jgi:hypothetical protein
VNPLRQLMLEELHRRNFAKSTIRTYLHGVAHHGCILLRRRNRLDSRHEDARIDSLHISIIDEILASIYASA